jgi:hypothetical protein
MKKPPKPLRVERLLFDKDPLEGRKSSLEF